AVLALFELLRSNADADSYLRHATVMGLTRIGDVTALVAAARDQDAAVRMGALLALRRLHRDDVAMFLNDASPAIVLEAARAINDEPINGGMPELAALSQSPLLRNVPVSEQNEQTAPAPATGGRRSRRRRSAQPRSDSEAL